MKFNQNNEYKLKSCLCPAGFYDLGINNTCGVCEATCSTCNGSTATNCVSCVSGRFLSGTVNS